MIRSLHRLDYKPTTETIHQRLNYRNHRAFTLIELLCIIAIIVLIAALLMPSLSKVKRISTRVVCATNLKGMGTAMAVYANDYEDMFPQLPGNGPWAKKLGFAYDLTVPEFEEGGKHNLSGRTITASLYLLVRESDMSPKSFVCPEAEQIEFMGPDDYSKDIVEVWDFGDDPYKHVSYSMHNPYGKFPGNGASTASFAITADMSPWFENGDITPPGKDGMAPQLITDYWNTSSYKSRSSYNLSSTSEWSDFRVGNSLNHANNSEYGSLGQNVTFGDGHTDHVKTSDVGVDHDNIYTFWKSEADLSEESRRIGSNPTSREPENDAKHENDSFLAI